VELESNKNTQVLGAPRAVICVVKLLLVTPDCCAERASTRTHARGGCGVVVRLLELRITARLADPAVTRAAEN